MQRKMLKIIKWATSIMLVAFLVYCAAFLRAGEAHIIQSDVLGESRTITVYLPHEYDADSARTYPVVYSLDGEKWRHGAIIGANARFLSAIGVAEAAIVVAVHTEGMRVRDYVPSNDAAAFLRFLKDEVIQWADNRYPVSTSRTLSGHSLGGLFTLYALMREPALFQAYIAYDPSILQDDDLLPGLTALIERGQGTGKFVYLNYGFHTARYEQRMNDLWSIIDSNHPKSLRAKKTYLPLPHALIMLPGQFEAIWSNTK